MKDDKIDKNEGDLVDEHLPEVIAENGQDHKGKGRNRQNAKDRQKGDRQMAAVSAASLRDLLLFLMRGEQPVHTDVKKAGKIQKDVGIRHGLGPFPL